MIKHMEGKIMTPEEAIDKVASRWYEGKSPQEIVEFQLYEDSCVCLWSFIRKRLKKCWAGPYTLLSTDSLKN